MSEPTKFEGSVIAIGTEAPSLVEGIAVQYGIEYEEYDEMKKLTREVFRESRLPIVYLIKNIEFGVLDLMLTPFGKDEPSTRIAAILSTNKGGMLCHGAIIIREQMQPLKGGLWKHVIVGFGFDPRILTQIKSKEKVRLEVSDGKITLTQA